VADPTERVRLLHPVRVLICGEDERFVARASADLHRLGFDVVAAPGPVGITALATSERADVVLLDAYDGLTAAAGKAAALEALPRPVEVLLATGKKSSAVRLGFDVVDPRASADELSAAVHRALRGGPARAATSG
jgi:CheY-like chemotaxis protein